LPAIEYRFRLVSASFGGQAAPPILRIAAAACIASERPLAILRPFGLYIGNDPPNPSAFAPWPPPKFRRGSRRRTRDGCVLVARLSRHGAPGPSSCDEALAWQPLRRFR